MAPRFTFETTAEQAASALDEEIKDKTIMIVGITPRSLGAVAAEAIVQHSPKLLIFASRTLSYMQEEISVIHSNPASANVAIRTLLVDLESQQSVRRAADDVLAWDDVPQIDVLINNASVMAIDFGLTPEGVERQFGINHLGHFLFTSLIMPKIITSSKSGRTPRIVQVGSRGFRFSEVRWDDVNFQNGVVYDRWKGYGQSKTANMLFAAGLAERLKPHGVEVFCLHPGMVPETNLGRRRPTSVLPAGAQLKALKEDGTPNTSAEGLPFKTLEQGGATEVIAAFDDTIGHANGGYLYEGWTEQDTPETERAKPYARGKELADRLWTLSEKLVEQKFEW